MMYKISFHPIVGGFSITKESNALRPILAYRDSLQIEKNIVYAIVKQRETTSYGPSLYIQLMDMWAPKNSRCFFLTFLIENFTSKEDRFGSDVTAWPLVKVGTNIVDPEDLVGRSGPNPVFESVFHKVWTHRTEDLAQILSDLQDAYHEHVKSSKHTAWLMNLSPAEVTDFAFRLEYKIGKRW